MRLSLQHALHQGLLQRLRGPEQVQGVRQRLLLSAGRKLFLVSFAFALLSLAVFAERSCVCARSAGSRSIICPVGKRSDVVTGSTVCVECSAGLLSPDARVGSRLVLSFSPCAMQARSPM